MGFFICLCNESVKECNESINELSGIDSICRGIHVFKYIG